MTSSLQGAGSNPSAGSEVEFATGRLRPLRMRPSRHTGEKDRPCRLSRIAHQRGGAIGQIAEVEATRGSRPGQPLRVENGVDNEHATWITVGKASNNFYNDDHVNSWLAALPVRRWISPVATNKGDLAALERIETVSFWRVDSSRHDSRGVFPFSSDWRSQKPALREAWPNPF